MNYSGQTEAMEKFGSLEIANDDGTNKFRGSQPIGAGGKVIFSGSHNYIEFGKNTSLNDLTIIVRGNHCKFHVGAGARLSGRVNLNNEGSGLIIGQKTSVERFGIVAGEGATITIGEDCMLSYGIEIRTTDSHSILDSNTGKRVNPPGDVTIGNHVWIGSNVLIGKGVVIPNDVIIGQGAIVPKSIEESNCVVAGNPARVIRTGTTWDRHLLPID